MREGGREEKEERGSARSKWEKTPLGPIEICVSEQQEIYFV